MSMFRSVLKASVPPHYKNYFPIVRLLDNPTVLTQDCGSPLYRSPEIFKGQPYSEKVYCS